jgi:hypothetical protein
MVSMIKLSTVASLVKAGSCMYGSIISMNGFTNKVRHGKKTLLVEMKNTQVIPSTFFQHTPRQPMMTCCKQLLLLEQPCLTLLVKPFILIIEPYMQLPAFTSKVFLNNTIRVQSYPVCWHTFEFNRFDPM